MHCSDAMSAYSLIRAPRAALGAGAACAAALALAAGLPGTATAKKPTVKATSGLACLVGKWISNGIQSPDLSGLAGTVLTIQRSTASQSYVNADADYDHSSPLKVAGAPGYITVEGSVFARIYYEGHGNYKFTAGVSSEEITVYGDGMKLIGPIPVKHAGGYADLKCNATTLTTKATVPTSAGAQATVKSTFRRAH